MPKFKAVELTPTETRAAEIARVGFMSAAPFYAHYFYDQMSEFFTRDVAAFATDGRRIFINPDYLCGLKPMEAVFAYTHEVEHVVSKHPQRIAAYTRDKEVRGTNFDPKQFNEALDYTINAGLKEMGVGQPNPSWLFDPQVAGSDLAEDVYVNKYVEPPPDDGQGQGNGQGAPSTFGSNGQSSKGQKPDPHAEGNGGGFDDVMPPEVDPTNGQEDIPSESEFKESVARAASAAKAVGKMPASLQRRVDEILEPQVDWRDHIRMLLTGHLGAARETWDKLNRRYAALGALTNGLVPQFPGRRGFGAGDVVVAIDNSGSIGEDELQAFFTEVSGILADVRPKRVLLIWCDSQIHQVDEARSLDELTDIRVKGAPGGGGTSFVPPFEWVTENEVKPDALIYLTDLYGSAPEHKPGYPVIWACITEEEGPWGDTVHIKVERKHD